MSDITWTKTITGEHVAVSGKFRAHIRYDHPASHVINIYQVPDGTRRHSARTPYLHDARELAEFELYRLNRDYA